MSPARDPKKLTPLLREFWPKLKEAYEKAYPGRFLFLSCTYRSPEEQKALYDQNRPGRVLTRCDGFDRLSNHNYDPARAFDCFIVIDNRAVWEPVYYTVLGKMIKELGYEGKIRWGGWFSSFKDYPHFEEMGK
jgi:peptidoglycan L-alanyl-D-glutamate endopeptidase CwlK